MEMISELCIYRRCWQRLLQHIVRLYRFYIGAENKWQDLYLIGINELDGLDLALSFLIVLIL